MSTWVTVHYRVVVTVYVKIKSVYRFIISIIYIILRDESTNGWVIISRFEIIKSKLTVVIIATVSYWVKVTNMRCVGYFRTTSIINLMVAPSSSEFVFTVSILPLVKCKTLLQFFLFPKILGYAIILGSPLLYFTTTTPLLSSRAITSPCKFLRK